MFNPPRTFYCGLLPTRPGCKREDFPLMKAKVHYDVFDVQMLATLTQTYTSNAPANAEIRYVFPLPPDASVCAFKALIDGDRTIKGTVREKGKARAEYDQAVSQGKTAALMEQDNTEIFQLSLGNIRPRQTITVHMSFVSVIVQDGNLDSLRLIFPTTIAPRYGTPPSGMFSSSGVNLSANILDFSVAVNMTSPIKSITSPSHPISLKLGESTIEPSLEFDPKKAHVSLASPTLLEKDIVLVLNAQGLDRPRCMVESFSPDKGRREYTDTYALTLVPRFELPPLHTQEYILLVDRSGSMHGGKMDAVRSALQILLMSLPSRGTSFNIMSFGSEHSTLWPSSVAYSAESVKHASTHVDTMMADYGGTEIRAAIEAAFASRVARPESETTSTSILLLTDGQAYDLHGVQSTIQQAVTNSKKAGVLLRIFVMGIGNAVSKAMCDLIARTGQGTAVFVGEEEKPDQKLLGLLRAARGALLEDLSVDWGVGEEDAGTDSHDFEMVTLPKYSPESSRDTEPISLFSEKTTREIVDLGPQTVHTKLPPSPRLQQAPPTKSLPPLYPGFRASLFAIVRRSEDRNATPSENVRIKGTVLRRPVTLDVPVSQTSNSTKETPTQIKVLHCLAARALIQAIEDKASTFMSEVQKAEVLRLAERYGLASSQTSFIAIDEQGELVDFGVSPTPTERSKSFSTTRGGGLLGSPRAAATSSIFAAPPPALASSALFRSPIKARKSQAPVLSSASFGSAAQPQNETLQRLEVESLARSHRDNTRSLPGSHFIAGGGATPVSPFGLFSMKYKKSGDDSKAKHSSPSTSVNTPSEYLGHQSPSVETFARAQSFDGSFTGSPSLFQLLFQQSQAPPIPPTLDVADTHKEIVWCTLLCIAYLEVKFADDREVWMILMEKAMQFVEDTLLSQGGQGISERVQDLKQAALKCII